jgi:UPF0755 protein
MYNIKDSIIDKKVIPSERKISCIQKAVQYVSKQLSGRSKKVIAVGVMILFLIVAAAAVVMPSVLAPQRQAYIQVQENMTAADIADVLYQKGIIHNRLWFRIMVMKNGQASQLKQGLYYLDSHMSMDELLDKIASGKSEAIRFVVPEGYSVQQIARDLEKQHIVKAADFLAAANRADLLYPYMNGNRSVSYRTEGFLYPDTYFIPMDMSADKIVSMMLKEFDSNLTTDMRDKISAMNLSIYQFTTLASLVEKEAKYDEDRYLIAAVFRKRLELGMPLQSDACISYVMGVSKATYSIEETKLDSPYNTYVYPGLPPGPIANAGMASMKAVLDAPPTDYLFFVADADGHNHFSQTYEEHLETIKEYT